MRVCSINSGCKVTTVVDQCGLMFPIKHDDVMVTPITKQKILIDNPSLLLRDTLAI